MADPMRITKTRVTQTLDLSEIVGKDISGNSSLVKKLAQGILDYMVQRSSDGLGLGRKELKSPYTDSYAESGPFKAAGKSKSQVNMRLSSDMIRSMDLLEEEGSVITYGIDNPDEAIKAYAHQTGFKGHPTIPNGKYKREWFGVTKEEIKKHVLPEFQKDLSGSTKLKEEKSSAESRVNKIRKVSDLLDVEDDQN